MIALDQVAGKTTPRVELDSQADRTYEVRGRRLTWGEVRALNRARTAAMIEARRRSSDPDTLMAVWDESTRLALDALGAPVIEEAVLVGRS